MKKGKEFNVGDKVFAKVKGYPAWPAIIIEDQVTKYNVKFYGTGETGIVKSKDLFYYLKHKDKFLKPIKRKDYKDAVEEIEKAIEISGTDGSDDGGVTSVESMTSDGANTNKAVKRKRSVSSDISNDAPIKKKVSAGIEPNDESASVVAKETREVEKSVAVTSSDKNNLQSSSTKLNAEVTPTNASAQEKVNTPQNDTNEDKGKVVVKEEQRSDDKKNEITSKLSIDDVIPVRVEWVLAYVDHVRKNQDTYKDKPVEKRPSSKNEVVFAKTPSGKFVAIKYNRDEPPPCETEYDKAEYDESVAKNILSLKTKIEDGSYIPGDDTKLFELELNVTERQIQQAMERTIVERKRTRLKSMKKETQLLELDAIIKACLGLDKAEPKSALDYLDVMLQLEIEPLMLKKQPAIVDMVKRLRRYIGNVKEWNLSKEQLQEFQQHAQNIREKAIKVYKKFASLFNVSDDTLFWDFYSREVEKFKKQTAHMPENDVMLLTDEPDSRQSFMDKMCEEEASKLITAKAEKSSESVN